MSLVVVVRSATTVVGSARIVDVVALGLGSTAICPSIPPSFAPLGDPALDPHPELATASTTVVVRKKADTSDAPHTPRALERGAALAAARSMCATCDSSFMILSLCPRPLLARLFFMASLY
ncbi:MAG TPA: hypothetical protein VNO21_19210 [Polyangiaceae bacterium]|nr:hypothetical protein [Polyangiaceae bacterium]